MLGRKLVVGVAVVTALMFGTSAAEAREATVSVGSATWGAGLFAAGCAKPAAGLGVRAINGATADDEPSATQSFVDLSLSLTPSGCETVNTGAGTVSGQVRHLGQQWWQGWEAVGTYSRVGTTITLNFTVRAVEYSYNTGTPTGNEADAAVAALVIADGTSSGRAIVSHTSEIS